MMNKIRLDYSEKLMRQAVKGFFRRKMGIMIPFFIIAVTVGIIYFGVTGVRTWKIGMFATLDGFVILTAGLLYYTHLKVALKRFSLLEGKSVMLTMDNEKFHFKSAIGESHLKWELIKKIWRFEDYFLIFYSMSEFNTIPSTNMTNEEIEFFFNKAAEHGAKIK